MKIARVTNITIDQSADSNYAIEISWRYGTSGAFFVSHLNAIVSPTGELLDPVDIWYDETINPTIQIKVTYKGCVSTPYYQIYS